MAYATQADLETIFGVQNVKLWASIEDETDQSLIDNRIAWCLQTAEDYVDAEMEGGPYKIPFISDNPVIKDITARKAGMLLYDARRIIDEDPAFDQLSIHRRMVSQIISDVHGNRITLIGEVQVAVGYPSALS